MKYVLYVLSIMMFATAAFAANPGAIAAQNQAVAVKPAAGNPSVSQQKGVSVEKVTSKKGKVYTRCRGKNGKFVKCPK